MFIVSYISVDESLIMVKVWLNLPILQIDVMPQRGGKLKILFGLF